MKSAKEELFCTQLTVQGWCPPPPPTINQQYREKFIVHYYYIVKPIVSQLHMQPHWQLAVRMIQSLKDQWQDFQRYLRIRIST